MSPTDLVATLNAKTVVVFAVIGVVATAGIGGAAMGIGPAGDLPGLLTEQQESAETAVSLRASSDTVTVGETTTYDVVVEDAAGGVGAYDFTVGVADADVASITGVPVQTNPSEQTNVSIADDGSFVDVTASAVDTSGSGTVTVATVAVRGDDVGYSDIELQVEAVGTEADDPYTVTDATGTAITVEASSEPEPAEFRVSNLEAPIPTTRGDGIDVSAEVENVGEQDGTRTVEFRVDADADGSLEPGETLASRDVSLDGGETEVVTFADVDTTDLDAGVYDSGVFTDVDSTPATIAIEEPSPTLETNVTLDPSSDTVEVGDTTTYDVVVEDAAGGVGAYDLIVNATDASVAPVTELTAEGNPSDRTTDTSVAENGSSGRVVAALADTPENGSVTVATVTVDGDDVGTSAVELRVGALGTEAGHSYTVTNTTGAEIIVEAESQPGSGPVDFRISDLDAPSSVTGGDSIAVSATLTNDGGSEGTRSVDFRLDRDGDGTIRGDETLGSQEVTLAPGETSTVTFGDVDTSALEPDEYTHGVATGDGTATASLTVISPSPDGAYTRDEIAQSKYGQAFDELSPERAGAVEELFLRQPFADGVAPEDVRTREEFAQDRYGGEFETLSREKTVLIQSDFDAQFGDTGAGAEYTRDEISQPRYGYDFEELSAETSGHIEEFHNRQPFISGLTPTDLRTRGEIANADYGRDVDDLSRQTRLEVESTYHAQFDRTSDGEG